MYAYICTCERERKIVEAKREQKIDEKVKQNNEYNQMNPNRWVSMDEV